MRLFEYQGKDLLKSAGLTVPKGGLVASRDEALEAMRRLGGAMMLKAQLRQGGRGKAGLIQAVESPRDCDDVFRRLSEATLDGERVAAILAEERVQAAEELYAAVTVDDVAGTPLVVASRQGGTDVEDRGRSSAEAVATFNVNPLRGLRQHEALVVGKKLGLTGQQLTGFARAVLGIYKVFERNDAILVEVNPLLLTPQGDFVAADAKVEIDDDALPRHPHLLELRSQAVGANEAEERAAGKGFTFIDLPGDVAVLSGGAGFTMALMDLVEHYGFKPANFCDAMGGSGPDVVADLADTVIEKANADAGVKAVLFNFVISGTPLESVVNGLVKAFRNRPCSKPVVGSVRAFDAAVKNMSLEEGIRNLEGLGFKVYPEIKDALDYLAETVKDGRTR